jgi:hypothetical protein
MRASAGPNAVSHIRKALGALLIALLFLVPAIDGAVCAADFAGDATQQTSVSDCTNNTQQHGPALDGACIHGHLHETAPMPEQIWAQPVNLATRDLSRFQGPPLKLHYPSSLERPPRT